MKDRALIQDLGITIARLAKALERSRQTVTRGISGDRDYLKPVDLVKALGVWRALDTNLYALAQSTIRRAYPEEAAGAIIEAAELGELVTLPPLTGAKQLPSGATINDFFLTDYPASYREDFKRAANLSIMGSNLRRLMYDYMKDISGTLDSGGTVKVILVNPRTAASRYAAIQDLGPGNDEEDEEGFAQTILLAYKAFLKVKNRNSNGANLTMKMIDYPLAFGMDVMEFSDGHGRIYLRYYPISTPEEDRPIVVLNDTDQYWYEFYKSQFLKHWDMSTDWDFPKKP